MKKTLILIMASLGMLICSCGGDSKVVDQEGVDTTQVEEVVEPEEKSWAVSYYVDEFGDPTNDGFITNTSYIKGQFSNSATEGAKLNVQFLINDSNDIAFQLYEYAGNNPVKAYSTEHYKVVLKDKDDNETILLAKNYLDRLTLDKKGSLTIHQLLSNGGPIKFYVRNNENGTSRYVFKIESASGYIEAHKELVAR
jgi:hypothetical protein